MGKYVTYFTDSKSPFMPYILIPSIAFLFLDNFSGVFALQDWYALVFEYTNYFFISIVFLGILKFLFRETPTLDSIISFVMPALVVGFVIAAVPHADRIAAKIANKSQVAQTNMLRVNCVHLLKKYEELDGKYCFTIAQNQYAGNIFEFPADSFINIQMGQSTAYPQTVYESLMIKDVFYYQLGISRKAVKSSDTD